MNESMQADPQSMEQKVRLFAAYCRSSAFEASDGPMLASAFSALADAVVAAEQRGAAREREECAKIIEQNEEATATRHNRRFLQTRMRGNQLGLTFAAAIRARGETK